MTDFWKEKRVLLTGGAGFIGSHILTRLLQKGADVIVIDDLSKGTYENYEQAYLEAGSKAGDMSRLVVRDLANISAIRQYFNEPEVVLHIAAAIAGRNYQHSNPAWYTKNYAINHNVISLASDNGIDRVHYASTACVYPMSLQQSYDSQYCMKEEDANKDGWIQCDEIYGYSKYSGEQMLEAYHNQYGLKCSSSRYITAYGPRENDTHAMMALIRRALEHREPYTIYGTGEQDRDFGYVKDIAEGTLLAAEKATENQVYNFGTGRRFKIKDVASYIFDAVGWRPERIVYDTAKPEGPKSRALDITKAKTELLWTPQYDLLSGLLETIQWFRTFRPKPVDPDLLKEKAACETSIEL